MHQEHLAALLERFLQQRSSFVLRDVHVVEQLLELVVDLLLAEALDQLLEVRRIGRFARRQRTPPIAMVVVVARV